MKVEELTFEKYGFEFKYSKVTETHPEWVRQVYGPDGKVLDLADKSVQEAIEKRTISTRVDWVNTGKTVESSYVTRASFKESDQAEKLVEIYSTPDGPILGVEYYNDEDEVVLQDPCVLVYDGKRISYLPIFNVGRRLKLYKSAVRSRQAPSELILANYASFIIQNRMAAYQLKPLVPLATTGPVENSADEAVTINTR